jgi:type VII secretion-associated serine protease mycosin
VRGRTGARAAAAGVAVVALLAVSAGCAAMSGQSGVGAGAQAPGDQPPDIDPPSPAEALLDRAGQTRSAAAASAKAQPGEPPATPAPVADSLAVTFEAGTSSAEVTDTVDDTGAAVVEEVPGTEVVEVDTSGADQADVTAELEADPAVEAVEPNLERRASEAATATRPARTPGDPELGAQQPYLTTVGLPTAWDVADTGAGATVAVLDTGVDADHPELAGALVPGFDAVHEDSQPEDDNGHGTAVAGVIGAATGNGVGIAGVAWNARIMPVKVLGADGVGTDVDIAQGIVWAADHGADVINLSLGGPGASTALDQAVQYAQSKDAVVVAAAGNESSPALHYPAGAPGVLGVTATDSAGRFAWFSNHGPWVTLAAPGIDIRTTAAVPGATPALANETGTSFSSPIVAGVAALVRERHPAWGWDSVAWELVRTARDAGPAGIDDSYGYGVVDAAAALGVAPQGPNAQPNLANDAANLPPQARPVAVGTPAQETIGYETDEDWFSFTAGAAGDFTVTVTPPPVAEPLRAQEIDPAVELYRDGGGLVASGDSGFEGDPETVTATLDADTYRIRVRNYGGSTGPAPYTVAVAQAPATGTPAAGQGAPWFTAVSPTPHGTGAPGTVQVTLGRPVAGGTVNGNTVALIDGRTGALVPSAVSWASPNIVIRPQVTLRPATAYVILVAGVTDTAGELASFTSFPFVTPAGAAPTYAVDATFSPFALDIDGNRYSDAFWYGPGTARDSLWLFDMFGRVGATTSVRGTYVPLPGDFDGNGYDDVLWYAPGTAADSFWYSGPDGIRSQAVSVRGTYRPVVGDFDRNGYDDVFWHAPGAPADTLWLFSPFGITRVTRNVNGDYRPLGGDFNRDGYDDILWYSAASTDSLWVGGPSGLTSAPAPVVTGTWNARVLDTNGDGFDDVYWYASGTRALWRGGPSGFAAAPATAVARGAQPLAGEFTGDLRDDLLGYVPGTAPDPLLLGRDGGLG